MGKPLDEIPDTVFYEVQYRSGGWWFRSSTQLPHPVSEGELLDRLATMQRDRAAMRPPFRPKDQVDAIRLVRHETYLGPIVAPQPDSK